MWLWNRTRRQVEKLVERAHAAFDIPDYEEVLGLAEQILAHGDASGYELKARALAGLGREPEALAVMEQAVELAPGEASLWTCLGEYRSSAGNYRGAHEAFERAGILDPEYMAESAINDAVVFQREHRPDLALATLDRLAIPETIGVRGFFARVRADTLLDLERFDETISFCAREIGSIVGRDGFETGSDSELDEALRSLQISKATALWRGRKDGDAALELCYSAVHHTGARGPGFTLIREIDGLNASCAKPFHLLCHGRVLMRFFEDGVAPDSVPEAEQGYVTTYRVLADTPEEAHEFVERFERREWGEKLRSLVLEKASAAPDTVTGCKGIYFRSGRVFALGRDEAS